MKNNQDGGEAIVQAYRALGVDYVMASPGSEWGAVWEAFARQKVGNAPGPTYLSCAHETLAVDLAIGYTVITGRMQAVMLHTGVGLLQGAMGIDTAQRQGIPMVVTTGEALTYGERDGFDPGPQWQSSLSVVGGTHRLAEPLVKWAQQASSPETLYHQLVLAGELAQRAPTGPTYLGVPIETMLAEWTPDTVIRDIPPAPKPQPSTADIERVADLLAASKTPVIMAEAAGRDPESYNALVALAETLSIPVVDGQWADYTNFPKDHPLYQGAGRPDFLNEADLILLVRCRSPWYPPSSRPAKARVVAIDETPFKTHMVHQSLQADLFLEGDAAASLTLLAEAVGAAGVDSAAVKKRGERWAAAHDKFVDNLRSAVESVRGNKIIHPDTLSAALSENLPDNAIYVDETITHRHSIIRHTGYKGPHGYIRVQGGLGQGLGTAMGVKLAAPDRPVVATIGDGSFMYNPITQALALSHHEGLPILIVVYNNGGYSAMRREHHAFYPEGVASANDLFYGHTITDLDYAELVKPFGGFGRQVETAAELPEAIAEGQAAVAEGRTAILNVQLDPMNPVRPS